MPSDEITRRELLGKAGRAALAGAAVPLLSKLPTAGSKPVMNSPTPSASFQNGSSPNDKIVFGLIGCGGMGAANMRSFMNFPDVEIAAVCDVDEDRMPGDIKSVTDKYGRAPEVFRDYRKMLERKDIDAIIVGSPDHWHALNLIHSVEAGKDCYCEKPISHDINEAKNMVAAAHHHNRVVQVGTWQRSTKEFTDAISYIRAGKLGKIVLCRAWITENSHVGHQDPSAPPKNLDYDFWVGPAKFVPYAPNHVHFNWRWFLNTGGGMSCDWGVHMIDIALLGMSKDEDLPMPTTISSAGGQLAILGEDRDAPDTLETIYRFHNPDFVLLWSILRDHPGKPGHGTEFVSADGKTLRVWRGGWVVLDADGKELPKEESDPPGDHWRNFLDCVKSREKPRADLASVAQTTICCHLANIAWESNEMLRWDNEKMDLVGRAGKNAIGYRRDYRDPWRLPRYA